MRGDRNHRRPEPPAIRSTEEVEEQHAGVWRAWLATLTPDEVAALEKAGLTAPELPRKGRRRRRQQEEEDEPGAGTCDHLAGPEALEPDEALMAKEEAAAAERPRNPAAAYEIDELTRRDLVLLGYVLPAVIDAADPRLEASIIALALGIGARQGISLEALAHRHCGLLSTLMGRVHTWQRNLDVCRASLGLLRVVISPILASRNPRLEAETIAMAARFGLSGGQSMTARGEHHGVCKAAISARVRRWVRRFGLALPNDCKRQTANYVLFNVRKEKPKSIVAE